MIYDSILIRYGELFLKGKNRHIFEDKLIDNIRKITGQKTVKKLQSRLVMSYFAEHLQLQRVFGLLSYSLAVKTNKDMNLIRQKALELVKDKKGSFKVETNRADKSFPFTSLEISREIGKYIEQNSSVSFSLHDPGIIINIEINQAGAYIFSGNIYCHGGLPTGVEGRVLLLVEDESSILAGLLFMKRGCTIVPIAFKKQIISLLQMYSPADLSFILVKNEKEIEKAAAKKDIMVIVSGQSFRNHKGYLWSLSVMRPLIAYDQARIERELNEYQK